MFLIKGLDWQYEREWRLIYKKKQMYDINDDKLYEGNLNFKSVSALYLGYRIHPVIRQNILEICQRIEDKTGIRVGVYQETLDAEGYSIRFMLIR